MYFVDQKNRQGFKKIKKSIYPEFVKRKIQKKVYYYYIDGIDIQTIAILLDLSITDVDDIVDYLNNFI